MSGWKKIKKMIQNKNLGDVKYKELKNYLETEGYQLDEGPKHAKVMTHDYASTAHPADGQPGVA